MTALEAYRANREEQIAEVKRLLVSGVTLHEHATTFETDWHSDQDGISTARSPHGTGEPHRYIFGPGELARHLVQRSLGFGFDLRAWCVDCGKAQVPITTSGPDDPVCGNCETARKERG